MNKYADAERLYLRSIAIGKKLFGPSYSGLEYDYRGLLRLYQAQSYHQLAAEYETVLQEWALLRGQTHNADTEVPLQFSAISTRCEDVVREFFTAETL
jgi:hypothetical protein